MKKRIAILLILVLSLLLALLGCGDGGNASGSDTATDSSSSSDGYNPKDGYLDEATGTWHTTLYYYDHMPISYAVPDGWWVMDGFGRGASDSIWADGTEDNTVDEADVPGIILDSNGGDDAQELYDSMNKKGRLGESHEVTYGSNVYISNVTPTEDYGTTYFFYTGKPDGPIVFLYTGVKDTNKAALEEVLSTLTY